MFDFLKSNDGEDSNLLPPPVRRLVFGEKSEEEELKALIGDFCDQVERLEEAHDSHYEKLELVIDGSGRQNSQYAEIKLKKKTGEKPTTTTGGYRSSTMRKKDTNYNLINRSFGLTELMQMNRNYLIDRVKTDPDNRVEVPGHSTTVEVVEGEVPDRDDLAGMDEKSDDQNDNGFESPLSGEGSSDMKENILDHTG